MNEYNNKFSGYQQEWIHRLESGNYQQIQDSLVGIVDGCGTDLGYCCLGVAAAALPGNTIVSKDDVPAEAQFCGFTTRTLTHFIMIPKDFIDPENDEQGATVFDCLLPSFVVRTYNLYSADGQFAGIAISKTREQDGQNVDLESLAGLNDTGEWSFSDIAYIIKENPGLVFTNFWPIEAENIKIPEHLELLGYKAYNVNEE